MSRPSKRYTFSLIILIIVITLSSAGCFGLEPAKNISIDEVESTNGAQPEIQPMRIAVSAMVSPKETMIYYNELLDYVSERTGYPVELVQRETYMEVNDLVENQYIDAGFVCTGAYVEGHDKFGMELLVAPLVNGEPYYYSYIIVSQDSKAETLEDIRGKKFAFTDPLSNTGKLAPTYMLALMGETPDSFFSRYIYTQSHDRSIEAVAKNLVYGAAVDSLIWDYSNETNPEFTSKTKIIRRSDPYGIPPVVVHPDTDPELKNELKNIFLTMHKDPKGAEILEHINIDRFVEIEDSEYDSVRNMSFETRILP
ncbi:MAG: phosphate/phosphite/phosphonate ABC transporter substrate-binding protein [ANME-2 cluster archaeon]|nr:phosphate/phosphite/phosphonate ABC transporter substrate-binding protein [ANME-2 cluster archaeon]